MGHGWQALVRLAALEVIESYAEAAPTPVMLLCEEPEVYLHPHLRRKLRGVLHRLAEQGWLVVSATHATEFVSFQQPQQVVRLWRQEAGTSRGQLLTDALSEATKFQARLDERGNHELVLANRVVFCEGKDEVKSRSLCKTRSGAPRYCV
jgi:predicted ATP-dependent endonuclease of OLD family